MCLGSKVRCRNVAFAGGAAGSAVAGSGGVQRLSSAEHPIACTSDQLMGSVSRKQTSVSWTWEGVSWKQEYVDKEREGVFGTWKDV